LLKAAYMPPFFVHEDGDASLPHHRTVRRLTLYTRTEPRLMANRAATTMPAVSPAPVTGRAAETGRVVDGPRRMVVATGGTVVVVSGGAIDVGSTMGVIVVGTVGAVVDVGLHPPGGALTVSGPELYATPSFHWIATDTVAWADCSVNTVE
jgi:hypothetical protein